MDLFVAREATQMVSDADFRRSSQGTSCDSEECGFNDF